MSLSFLRPQREFFKTMQAAGTQTFFRKLTTPIPTGGQNLQRW